jgi:hypothetical protein
MGALCVGEGRERGATVQNEAAAFTAGEIPPETALPSPLLLRKVPAPAEGGGGALRRPRAHCA